MIENNKIPGQVDGDEVAVKAEVSSAKGGAGDEIWLKFAKDAYNQATSFFETNYQRHWEDSLRMFNSQHPRDSKYLSDAYKYRSRYFRPEVPLDGQEERGRRVRGALLEPRHGGGEPRRRH